MKIPIPTSMPRCSVIIPVFNNSSITKQCLDAIPATSGCDLEVIVVDDASTDATPKLLVQYRGRLRVITHKGNEGFAKSCNDGAASATGKFLVFLNNDTIPQPGWLDALVEYANANPAAAVVGAKLLYPDDTIQHAGMAICEQRHAIHIYKGFPRHHDAVNKSRQYPVVTGACMLVRRELFEKANGFNTAYRNGHEDADLCLRLREAGHEVHYCHRSELYHMESCTRHLNSADEQRNLQLYYNRWRDRVRQDDFVYYFQDGLLQLQYTPLYPIQISYSPMLATPYEPGEDSGQTNNLLHSRMLQVSGLLQENLRMFVRLQQRDEMPGQAGPAQNSAGIIAKSEETRNERLKRSLRLENENFKLELQKSTARMLVLLEGAPDQSALVDGLQKREAELREMLLNLHDQLMQRDEMIILGNINRFDEIIEELEAFLEGLDQAVTKLYSSRRWAWANHVKSLVGFLGIAKRPRGYWRIDDILKTYRDWRERHLVPLRGFRRQANHGGPLAVENDMEAEEGKLAAQKSSPQG